MKARQDSNNDSEIIERQANVLMISMNGLSADSKVFIKKQLDNYIERILESI